jgi:hypothetical protein
MILDSKIQKEKENNEVYVILHARQSLSKKVLSNCMAVRVCIRPDLNKG